MENTFHSTHVHKLRAFLNITYTLLYFLAITSILYYRANLFFYNYYMIPSFLPWLTISAAEILFFFLWIVKQPMHWRPVTRTVFPENLPKDEDLPRIDVFICTADPDKEPTFEVMNTVISAMSLDYPAENLSVYLSHDGGASVTLFGIREAWVFATWWLPFCRKYNVKPICPQAYFQNTQDDECLTKDFVEHRKIVQEKYETLKQRLSCKKERDSEVDDKTNSRNHPACVEVINENSLENEAATLNPEAVKMPLLVYVAREKRPSHPHCFKAGALNTLFRISSIMSNAPYVLVLDCDMYCNDSISARQAMCFYLDSKISPLLGWVQFPQKFYNISETDVYDSQFRVTWPVIWPGFDGLQGPGMTGTNLYINRKALYDMNLDDGVNLKELRETLGPSNEFIKTVSQIDKPNVIQGCREISNALLQEAHFLASCTYEKGTKWGRKVGFWYNTIVEDMLTSYHLQSKGWRSVYLNPERPQFLGSAITNINDFLVQGMRWYGGFADLCLSKYFPLLYRPSSRMQFLQKSFYCWIIFMPIDFIPVLGFAIVPPICFNYGIPLYPKLSDPFFIPFAFVLVSSHLKSLCDMVLISGGSIRAWLNEQRMWMAKCLTCYLYGTLECVLIKLKLREAMFTPTNKAGDDDTTNWYQLGKYDFRTSNMFLVSIVTAVALNVFSFVGGMARLIVARNWDAMFAQVLLSIYALVISYPVIEGIFLRKDNARVPLSASVISTILSLVFLSLGYFILL